MNVSNSLVSAYTHALSTSTGANRVARDGRASYDFPAENQKQLAPARDQGKTVPAEKIIEGELLDKSQGALGLISQYNGASNNAFVDLLQGQRFSIRGGNPSDTQQRSIQAAGEGINAYLSNADLGSANNSNSSLIDIFA